MGKEITFPIVLLLAGCVAAPTRTMPSGYVVAPQRHVEAVSYWSPTPQQIDAAQNALADLFMHPPPTAKARMKFPLSDYVIRFHGDVVEGRSVVVAEGYQVSGEAGASLAALEREMADPRNTVREVLGGARPTSITPTTPMQS